MVLTPPSAPVCAANVPLRTVGLGFHAFSFAALGTTCRVEMAADSRAAAAAFRERVVLWVADFERQFSRFVPGSLVNRINAAAGRDEVPLDAEAESLFALCEWAYWTTRGIFDPTALPLIDLWDYHRDEPRVPEPAEVRAALGRVGWEKVRRTGGALLLSEAGMAVDVGGIGKEYAVDRVLDMGLRAGFASVHVNFGHDVRVHGGPPEGGPWRIGLEDPSRPGHCWAGVAVRDRAVAGSGAYLRHFEAGGRTYGHIIDPRTGYPVDNGCRAVTVIAPTCTEAGVLSTAAFVLGPQEGLALIESHYGAEGCVWTERELMTTGGFDDYLIR